MLLKYIQEGHQDSYIGFHKASSPGTMFLMCRLEAVVFVALIPCFWCDWCLRSPGMNRGKYKQISTYKVINYRPVIGVLAQENDLNDNNAEGSSYIPASYVKFLEGGGARVAPIRVNLNGEVDYKPIFYSINGLLLPGGDADLEKSKSTEVAKIFYNLALDANNNGDYFPIWGACQGFQQLSYITSGENLLMSTNTSNMSLPLTITPAARSSRLFSKRSFPEDVLESLGKENITPNFHQWSLTTKNFSKNDDLRRFYRVLSTNTVGKVEFISTMEARCYPFYALQWHPEKTQYEWIDKPGMVHTTPAVRASFYAARFFVTEAMKSNHTFNNSLPLIYNFTSTYKGMESIFMQNYYFD